MQRVRQGFLEIGRPDETPPDSHGGEALPLQDMREVVRAVLQAAGAHEGAREREELHMFGVREGILAVHQPGRPQQDAQRNQESRLQRLREKVSACYLFISIRALVRNALFWVQSWNRTVDFQVFSRMNYTLFHALEPIQETRFHSFKLRF